MTDKFQGKWVEQLITVLSNKRYGGVTHSLIDAQKMLDYIDVILQVASSETDNEFLHDDIEKLLKEGFTK